MNEEVNKSKIEIITEFIFSIITLILTAVIFVLILFKQCLIELLDAIFLLSNNAYTLDEYCL